MMDNGEKQYIEKVYLTALSLWGKDTAKMKEHIENTFPEILRLFEKVVFEANGGKPIEI